MLSMKDYIVIACIALAITLVVDRINKKRRVSLRQMVKRDKDENIVRDEDNTTDSSQEEVFDDLNEDGDEDDEDDGTADHNATVIED